MIAALLAASACAVLGQSVPLLTGDGGFGSGCSTNWEVGRLVVDSSSGTALRIGERSPVPIMWPAGYTGHMADGGVAVVDGHGQVIATTGHAYQIDGGMLPKGNAFLACDRVIAQQRP